MSKAVVKVAFVDKYTGAFYNVGCALDLSEERAKEILATGDFIEVVDAPAPKKASRKKKA